ncbi:MULTISPECIES: hypothetical protein [Streptomyces]|uniref:Uncharacterized protein n=1 Tax=Streptomyces lonegramiae TaxID=3075524 RepID=A0ABU2X817_9ACTN|nr:hypothetical protein [Streptomyces sp. DSM 41529]MDT0542060.1 hypothetical protein [Streptomyces sp. DSM 41529]
MATSAQLLFSALAKPVTEAGEPDPFAGVSYPDCGLCGLEGSGLHTEAPLTSEPAPADIAPLTSEPPLAAEPPLTSEPTGAAFGTGAGAEPMEF